jgi:hypothetical protein
MTLPSAWIGRDRCGSVRAKGSTAGKTYDFGDSNTAFADSESGQVLKPLLVF